MNIGILDEDVIRNTVNFHYGLDIEKYKIRIKEGSIIRESELRNLAFGFSSELSKEQLRKLMEDDDKVAGIATTAYYYQTGDILPIVEHEYGGLGIILGQNTEDPIHEGLELESNQFYLALLEGLVLPHSKISGYAGFCSIGKGRVLFHANTSEHALEFSSHEDQSLRFSDNGDFALIGSFHKGRSLVGSTNRDNAGTSSVFLGRSLENSTNYDETGMYSDIGEFAMRNAWIGPNAFEFCRGIKE